MNQKSSIALALCFIVWTMAVQAEEIRVSSNQQLQQALNGAKAGQTILIEPGTYQAGVSVAGLKGEEERPIVIKAADPARRPVFENANLGWHISKSSYFMIDGLVIRNVKTNGLNIDDGGERAGGSHHFELHHIDVMDIGTNGGNLDGIKLSGLDDFKVVNCRIVNWGSGGSGIDMVGCHRGMIKNCYFKADAQNQGTGVQAKGGSSEVTVRACRFEQAGSRAVNIGGSTGLPYFRPEGANYEARKITVEDSVFIGSHAPIVFVGVDGAWVHHNTIYKPDKYAVRILQESRDPRFVPCRGGVFENNLVVYDPAKVSMSTNVGSGTDAKSFIFRNNAWISAAGRGRIRHEIPGENDSTANSIDFMNASKGDFRQRPGSPTFSYGSKSDFALIPMH